MVVGATPTSAVLIEDLSPLLRQRRNSIRKELSGQFGVLLVKVNAKKLAYLTLTQRAQTSALKAMNRWRHLGLLRSK